MKLTKDQIATLSSQLSNPYSLPIYLLCDDRKITLEVRLYKALQYRVMTFIDGSFKGDWVLSGTAHPEQKYLRKSVRNLYPPAKRAKLIKEFGKKLAEKIGANKTQTLYWSDWPNARAALNHLNKVCESIEVVEADK